MKTSTTMTRVRCFHFFYFFSLSLQSLPLYNIPFFIYKFANGLRDRMGRKGDIVVMICVVLFVVIAAIPITVLTQFFSFPYCTLHKYLVDHVRISSNNQSTEVLLNWIQMNLLQTWIRKLYFSTDGYKYLSMSGRQREVNEWI